MDVPAIEVDELARLHATGVALIDVRRPHEYEAYHAPGAVLIPLDELVERVDDVPAAGTVYVICESGGRSARAVQYLRSVGVDAVNVAGGSAAWRSSGHPTESGASQD